MCTTLAVDLQLNQTLTLLYRFDLCYFPLTGLPFWSEGLTSVQLLFCCSVGFGWINFGQCGHSLVVTVIKSMFDEAVTGSYWKHMMPACFCEQQLTLVLLYPTF